MSSEVQNQEWLALAVRAAAAGAAVLERSETRTGGVRSESGKDLKLQADVAAETAILECLRAGSNLPVLSEEAGEDAGWDRPDGCWVVDPLDGTVNYGRGLPLTCVSIGLWRGSKPVLGVIHDFERREVFTGLVGGGAECNGRPMRVHQTDEVGRAILATGFPSGRDFGDAPLLEFCRRIQRFKKVRLLGSAALSLAWVAAGRVDAYAEDGIWLWDVAAGLALVEAAGGAFEITPGARRHQIGVKARGQGLGWEW